MASYIPNNKDWAIVVPQSLKNNLLLIDSETANQNMHSPAWGSQLWMNGVYMSTQV